MAINYGKLNAKLTPRGSLKATVGVSGPLNSDYEALINKPQINGNELIGDKSNADLGIPTALEDLTDDSTHRVVTDEQIDAWDNKSDFSGSYNDLTDKPTIPDELADLTDDSTHRLVTDTEKTTWNAKSDFSGSYNDLTDVPANLVQDANYVHTDNNYDDTAKGKVNALGTASTKNVPVSGDASTSEVVLGNDTRLTDDRNAKDVYSWAKASTKPSYTATEVGAIASTLKGTANGVAELDANGKVPSAQLPSYVDDVLEYASTSAFPQTGESGKIYIALDTNKTYRWGGSAYVEISESLALGETDSTAYAGNKGKQNADNIATIQGLIPSSATTSNKLATANDIPDISGKADKSEMSVSTSNDLTTIQLKSGTSATVINAHQDISGKANKSEMSVSTSGDKTTIQLKSGTSAEVLNQHQDISGKVDKVQGKGLSTNDYDDTAKGIVDGVTSALADKVDKVNGKGLSTEDYTTAEKTKLGAISAEANKVTSSSTNGHINIDGVDATVYDDSAVTNAISAMGDDIEDIQDELSTDSATIEGNPLNFSTLSAQNAESTIIDLEPIQDLHGYDKPWVGGAGKNKLPLTIDNIKAVNASSGTWSGNTYTHNNGVAFTILTDSDNNVTGIKVNGTSNGTSGLNLILQNTSNIYTGYILNCSNITTQTQSVAVQYFTSGSYVSSHILSSSSENYEITNEGTNIAIFIRIENGQTTNNLVFNPMLRLSSESDATIAPYENICPITGRTEIGILGCGVNLFNKNDSGVVSGHYLDYTTGEINPYSSSTWGSSGYIRCKSNATYILSGYASIGQSNHEVCFYDKDKSFISGINTNAMSIITPNNTDYIRFDYKVADIDNIQLELGSSATDYSPYTQSNNLTISFGQTVYGGQLDVEKGVLVVDEARYKISDFSWDYYSPRFEALGINYKGGDVRTVPILSSSYECISDGRASSDVPQYCIYGNETRLFIHDARYNNATNFVSAMGNEEICYELATPITINLAPHIIKLLEGVNNISVDDSGATITLTYRDGSVATLEDVSIAKALDTQIYNPTNGQVLKYDATENKWKNENAHNYSTTEQVIGTWIDGKPIYEKTINVDSISFTNAGGVGYYGAVQLTDYISNIKEYWLQPNSYYLNGNKPRGFLFFSNADPAGTLHLFVDGNRGDKECVLTLQYTKTID